MTYEEAIRILECDIHCDVPKSAVLANKHNQAVLKAIEALEKESEDVWIVIAHNRFYGIDEFNEPIYRGGGRTYVHRKCGYQSAVGSNFCPRCGTKMIKG